MQVRSAFSLLGYLGEVGYQLARFELRWWFSSLSRRRADRQWNERLRQLNASGGQQGSGAEPDLPRRAAQRFDPALGITRR